MSDDLVKRLREGCSCDNIERSECMAQEECSDAFEAADCIEKLKAERDDYAQKLMEANNTYTEMHLAIEELEAENARLWDALEVYANKLEEHEIECPNTKKETLKNDD